MRWAAALSWMGRSCLPSCSPSSRNSAPQMHRYVTIELEWVDSYKSIRSAVHVVGLVYELVMSLDEEASEAMRKSEVLLYTAYAHEEERLDCIEWMSAMLCGWQK